MSEFITIDFETFYDTKAGHTLKRGKNQQMTQEYICDPRFKVHGAAIKRGDGPSKWYHGGILAKQLATMGLEDKVLVGHRLLFDGLILSHRYGITPKRYIDTLGMARAVFGAMVGEHGLDYLGKLMKLGGKLDGGAALDDLDGVRHPDPEASQRLGKYANADANLTWAIFGELAPEFPEAEYAVLDMVTRMMTHPELELDAGVIAQLLAEREAEVDARVAEAGAMVAPSGLEVTRKIIGSGPKFAALWTAATGMEPPMKISPTNKKPIFAFAKDDMEFFAQAASGGPVAKALYKARTEVKSTALASRLKRFARIAALGVPMAAPINYSGALNTHRFSGCVDGRGTVSVERMSRGERHVSQLMARDVRAGDRVWDGTSFVECGGWVRSRRIDFISYAGIMGTPEHRVMAWKDHRAARPRWVTLKEARDSNLDLVSGNSAQRRAFGARTIDSLATAEARVSARMRDAKPFVVAGTYTGGSTLDRESVVLGDIVDCGPRNRFVYNGFIIHNSDGLNMQNMVRVTEDETRNLPDIGLRHTLRAPPGKTLVVADSAGIEFIIVMKMAQQLDVLQRRAEGADEYAEFASRVYDRPINKRDDPTERTIGKIGVLSLQYQSGALTFTKMLLGMTGGDILLPLAEGEKVVRAYRSTYTGVTALWRALGLVLDRMADGHPDPASGLLNRFDVPVRFERDGFVLPSGLKVKYPGICRRQVEFVDQKTGKVSRKWAICYRDVRKGGGWATIYPGKLLENMAQALAAEVVDEQLVEVARRTGYYPKLAVHDEGVFAVLIKDAETFARTCMKVFSCPPTWWPDLPVGGSVDIAPRYGDAK